MKKEFYVVIEKDEDGFSVGEVSALEGCFMLRDKALKNYCTICGT